MKLQNYDGLSQTPQSQRREFSMQNSDQQIFQSDVKYQPSYFNHELKVDPVVLSQRSNTKPQDHIFLSHTKNILATSDYTSSIDRVQLIEKFDQISLMKEKNKDKLIIEHALTYEDGRSHFVFDDKSAIILHPKGDCFTYFSKDGKKTRQLVKFAVQSTHKDDRGMGVLDKLVLAIQYHNTFCDEPILSREEILTIREKDQVRQVYERQQKFQKYTQVIWPGIENWEDFLTEDQDGNLTLRSVDEDLASITLSANGFQLSVKYQQLLPFKKPTWVNLGVTFDESTIKNITSDKLNQKDSRRMKMAYDYVRINQIFSIFRFPSRWCYPVQLLMQYKEHLLLRKDENSCQLYEPVYCRNFHGDIQTCCFTELVRNKEYSTYLPIQRKVIDEIDEEDEQNDSNLPQIKSMLSQTNLNRTNISQMSSMSKWDSQRSVQELLDKNNKITVWSNDDISPASFLHSHKKNVAIQWNTLSTTRVSSDGNIIQVQVHQDESILLLRENGQYISHLKQNNNLEPPLRQFTCETIPFSVVDSIDPINHPRLQLQEILAHPFVILKQLYEPNPLYVKETKPEEDHLSKASLMASQDNIILKEMHMEGLGHFQAYSNKSIKVSFEDRTILRMMRNCDIIRILNKYGEEINLNVQKPNILYNDYRNYIKVADEFYEWAFSSQEERQQKELEEQKKQEAIDLEMQKIQRTLCFIDQNKLGSQMLQQKNEQEFHKQTYQQSYNENQNLQNYTIGLEQRAHAVQELEVNQQKINEIQELLNALNEKK
ncbi:UNKNOWN [Stylonychia lemnae]|uniref:Uncharacterized protein n=1 Tax=Stylonychia lemnae TaxID=5949 RepID=A0A078ATQ6_STYLE|nr:UNKNOWN [Stylonychia lemnae]|eukprot:CDW85361.1 UNKNOWN [Stylonychia lemnae]